MSLNRRRSAQYGTDGVDADRDLESAPVSLDLYRPGGAMALRGVYGRAAIRRILGIAVAGSLFTGVFFLVRYFAGRALPDVVDFAATALMVSLLAAGFESSRTGRAALKLPNLVAGLLGQGNTDAAELVVSRAERWFGLTLGARAYVAWARVMCLEARGAWRECLELSQTLQREGLVSVLPPAVSSGGRFQRTMERARCALGEDSDPEDSVSR